MEFYNWIKTKYTVYRRSEKLYNYFSIKFYSYWREMIRTPNIEEMISTMYEYADPIHGLVYYFGTIKMYNEMNIVLKKSLLKNKKSFMFSISFAQLMTNMTDENLGKLLNHWSEQTIITSLFYVFLANKNFDWINVLSKVGINKNTIMSVIGEIKLYREENSNPTLLKDIIIDLDELN
jgi:hypothetical protein